MRPSYSNAIAVTKSDSTVLPVTAALYVGGTGDVAVKMGRADAPVAVVFKAVPAGVILPIAVFMVMSTSTTATDIVALR